MRIDAIELKTPVQRSRRSQRARKYEPAVHLHADARHHQISRMIHPQRMNPLDVRGARIGAPVGGIQPGREVRNRGNDFRGISGTLRHVGQPLIDKNAEIWAFVAGKQAGKG